MAKNRTAGDWAALVEGWKRSGLGGVEFAASAGVSVGQLWCWKWHLGKRAAKAKLSAPKRAAMVRVEVRASRTEEISSAIEIARDGWVVHVRRGVDRETLEQVLDAIAARSTC